MSKTFVTRLLSPRDAGRELGIGSSRIVQLAREGILPEFRDSSGRRLFRIEDVGKLKRARQRRLNSAPRASEVAGE